MFAQTKKEQQIFAKNLNEVSFYFLLIFGLIHILSGLLFTNEYLIQSSWLINKLLDIPLVWSILLYAYSNVKLFTLKNNATSNFTDLIIASSFTIIGFSIFIADLIFSNKLPL